MSTGETPATFLHLYGVLATFYIHMAWCLEHCLLFHRGTEFKLWSSPFMWLADLCAWTQTVLKHVLSFTSKFICFLTLGCKQRAHKNITWQLLKSSTLVPKPLHTSVHLYAVLVKMYSLLSLNAPITGLQPFLGILGQTLSWDIVFLVKVRRWSHDQNRMESYSEVCHGHPMWGHLYMQNMGEGRGPKRAGSSIWLHTHFWSKYSLSYMWW